MKIEISAAPAPGPDGSFAVRALIFNDSYEPVALSRNSLFGPTEIATTASGMPMPESAEATSGGPDEPMTLQPFCFYGRERWFDLSAGDHEFFGEYRLEGAKVIREVVTLPVPEREG
jgi:hypothetical protein